MTSQCTNWYGAKDRQGYGLIHVDGRTQRVSRIVFCDNNNVSMKFISGKVIRHSCDNPSCYNPNHLLIGTFKENSDDAVSINRIPKWESCKHSKLKINDVIFIRKNKSTMTRKELSEKFSVSIMTIYDVIQGKTWKGL
jgi:hypothetical protein